MTNNDDDEELIIEKMRNYRVRLNCNHSLYLSREQVLSERINKKIGVYQLECDKCNKLKKIVLSVKQVVQYEIQ